MADPSPPQKANSYHVPVLLDEVISSLAPRPGAVLLDATLGGAGHSAALAARITPDGALFGLDRDLDAIAVAQERLEAFPAVKITLVHTDFGDMDAALAALEGAEAIRFDGVLFDLGVSSHQLDTARGFSFRRDELLDMRMNAADPSRQTAAELLATADEAELSRILWEFGDEKWSRRIAQRIIERRKKGEPLDTTAQLAALIEQSIPRAAWPRDIHVATRSFQALRIAVNDELGQLRAGLQAAATRLAPGGRLAVISYHSLEDRIVKQQFALWAGRTPSAPGSSPAALMPDTRTAMGTLLTRKPIIPSEAEIVRNPRARSAKMRVLQRGD